MVNPYENKDLTHLRVVAPRIELLDSDCGGPIPEKAALGQRILTRAPEDHKRYWQEMVGTYLRNDLKLCQDLPSGLVFELKLPRSYELYGSMRSSGEFDYYLLGFHIDGTREKFDSPANFVLHAKWLAYGRPANICGCRPCTGRPQGEISSQLKLQGAKIRQPHDESTTTRSSAARRRRENANHVSRRLNERQRLRSVAQTNSAGM